MIAEKNILTDYGQDIFDFSTHKLLQYTALEG